MPNTSIYSFVTESMSLESFQKHVESLESIVLGADNTESDQSRRLYFYFDRSFQSTRSVSKYKKLIPSSLKKHHEVIYQEDSPRTYYSLMNRIRHTEQNDFVVLGGSDVLLEGFDKFLDKEVPRNGLCVLITRDPEETVAEDVKSKERIFDIAAYSSFSVCHWSIDFFRSSYSINYEFDHAYIDFYSKCVMLKYMKDADYVVYSPDKKIIDIQDDRDSQFFSGFDNYEISEDEPIRILIYRHLYYTIDLNILEKVSYEIIK